MSKQRKAMGLPIINAHAAGVDIGARIQVAAVALDLCETPVQTFQVFTAEGDALHDMRPWWMGQPRRIISQGRAALLRGAVRN